MMRLSLVERELSSLNMASVFLEDFFELDS